MLFAVVSHHFHIKKEEGICQTFSRVLKKSRRDAFMSITKNLKSTVSKNHTVNAEYFFIAQRTAWFQYQSIGLILTLLTPLSRFQQVGPIFESPICCDWSASLMISNEVIADDEIPGNEIV
jgi:hypothetical protein